MVNQDRLVQTFLDLININSPSKQERGVVDYLKPRLEAFGFDVVEDDAGSKIGGNAGNIIATKKGELDSGARLFLSAHMDTVDSTEKLVPVITDDGIIKSQGNTILGADDKAGIAAILEALKIVEEKGIKYNSLQLVFSVAEEIGIVGAKLVDPSLIQADAGYVFDTGKPVAGVVVSAPSHENMLITVRGKASHAGIAPENGVSAILAASHAISRLKLGRIDDETTANIGVIAGGKARNIIPDEVVIRAEARSRNEEKLIAQTEHMKETFKKAAEEIGATVEIVSEREYTTYRWTENDTPVKLAVKAAESVGVEPQLVEGGGGSDANVYNVIGIPAVVVGVGYDNAHACDEYISISDLVKSAEYVTALISESSKC